MSNWNLSEVERDSLRERFYPLWWTVARNGSVKYRVNCRSIEELTLAIGVKPELVEAEFGLTSAPVVAR